MHHPLTKAELRYVCSGLALSVVVGVLALGAWLGPWSPRGLEQADAMLAAGESEAAMAAYLDLAAEGWRERDRADALWKAAQLARAEGELSEASVLLTRFSEDFVEDPRAAEALADKAELYLAVMDRPESAARAWSAAARQGTDPEQAGQWWLRAGRAWLEAGSEAKARVAFRAATSTEGTRTEAWLALGNLALGSDPAEAYDAYDRALRAAADGELGSLARLGMATAIERLDGAEAALAEVDAEAALDTALSRRRVRLEGQLQP